MPVGDLGSCGLVLGIGLALDDGLDFVAGLGVVMIYASIVSCNSALG